MRKLLFAALLAFSALATADYREFELAASAARTVTGNGSTVNTLPRQVNWVSADGRVLINVTAVTGTSPTLVVNLQCVSEAGTAYTLASSASITVTGVSTVQVPDMCESMRAAWTIGGTTPSFTFLVTLVRN